MSVPLNLVRKTFQQLYVITEFRLVNGLKVYFCAALDISTRRVLVYSLDTHQEAQLVKDTIQQIRNVLWKSQKDCIS
ncbi:TPA: hypothetical protein ACGXKU_005513 [Bacillus cereus]